jgi:hypothetical protein
MINRADILFGLFIIGLIMSLGSIPIICISGTDSGKLDKNTNDNVFKIGVGLSLLSVFMMAGTFLISIYLERKQDFTTLHIDDNIRQMNSLDNTSKQSSMFNDNPYNFSRFRYDENE